MYRVVFRLWVGERERENKHMHRPGSRIRMISPHFLMVTEM